MVLMSIIWKWTAVQSIKKGGLLMKEEGLNMILGVLGNYKMDQVVTYGLKFILRNSFESFIIVDDKARIRFMDRGSEKFFGLNQGDADGVDIRELVPDSGLPTVLKTSKPMIGRVFDVKGKKRIGSLYPILKDGKTIGAVGKLIFNSLEELDKVNKEIAKLRKEISYLKEKQQNEYSSKYTFDSILGQSSSIREVIDFAKKISLVDVDVLIMGESGTGKELFAHSIHSHAHKNRPFIKVNCPAIPFDLAESELFGYAGGAFSGALSSGKPGKFEMANNGTIFLDELSSLPLTIQAKLLRTLQEREIERLGSTKTEKINFRFIAATNVDLKTMVKEGKFREDLYYRISKAGVHIPPLRERTEDIPLYVLHYLNKINRSFNTQVKIISTEAMEVLFHHTWPGNLRELINILEQAVLNAWKGEEIRIEHLPAELTSYRIETRKRIEAPNTHLGHNSRNFKNEIKEREKEMITNALKETRGRRGKAAELLNMPRSSFYEKIKRYGID
jgi:transcriptional regulator with PAS, ATPase and Fis domain